MTLWLPLISSLVIASVTLLGIRINNHTNRAAIAAADEREHRKWQREMTLRLCGEAAESALHAHDDYRRLVERTTEEERGQLWKLIDGYPRAIGANTGMLHMLNASAVASACDELRAALIDAEFTSSVALLSFVQEGDPPDEAEGRWSQDVDAGLARIDSARAQVIRAASAELERLSRKR